MSHEVEANRFAYRDGSPIPWHVEPGSERDNRVSEADSRSFQKFMEAAHMDVTYEKVPVHVDPQITVPGLFAIRRQQDGLILPSVGVGQKYDILQPAEAFEFFQPFLESGDVILDTAAILRNGSRFYISAMVNTTTSEVSPGDTVRGYLLFYTSVDGSLVTGIQFVITRVVCANTLRGAMMEDAPRVRVKHTKGQRVALATMQEVMDFQTRSFTATVDQFRRLQRAPINKADLDKYIRLTLDFPVEAEASTKANNIVESVIDLAADGLGTEIPGVRGTVWGASNAITEYLNHEAGRNEWSRQDSLLFGEYAKTEDKALALALQLAA